MIDKNVEYADMYACYLEHEDRYWEWATERKRFMQAQRDRMYYRKHNAHNRKKYAEKVMNDFPKLALSTRDLKSQIGGCMEIIKDLNMTKFDDEPFWRENWFAYIMYDRLKNYPDEIYEAIEDIDEWSSKIGVWTATIAENFADVIGFICNECLSSDETDRREQMLEMREKVLKAEQERLSGAKTMNVAEARKQLRAIKELSGALKKGELSAREKGWVSYEDAKIQVHIR